MLLRLEGLNSDSLEHVLKAGFFFPANPVLWKTGTGGSLGLVLSLAPGSVRDSQGNTRRVSEQARQFSTCPLAHTRVYICSLRLCDAYTHKHRFKNHKRTSLTGHVIFTPGT